MRQKKDGQLKGLSWLYKNILKYEIKGYSVECAAKAKVLQWNYKSKETSERGQKG